MDGVYGTLSLTSERDMCIDIQQHWYRLYKLLVFLDLHW